jgi:hypothetical protein
VYLASVFASLSANSSSFFASSWNCKPKFSGR